MACDGAALPAAPASTYAHSCTTPGNASVIALGYHLCAVRALCLGPHAIQDVPGGVDLFQAQLAHLPVGLIFCVVGMPVQAQPVDDPLDDDLGCIRCHAHAQNAQCVGAIAGDPSWAAKEG